MTLFFNYDAYIDGGVGAIRTKPEAIIDPEQSKIRLENLFVDSDVGIGLRVFFSRWLAAVIEVRDLIFFDDIESRRQSPRGRRNRSHGTGQPPQLARRGTTRGTSTNVSSSCSFGLFAVPAHVPLTTGCPSENGDEDGDEAAFRHGVCCVDHIGGSARGGRERQERRRSSSPVRWRAPAVRHERLYRQGRFEIAPTVSFTLLDQYRRTIFVGARLNYNITDWLAIGVWGAYAAVSTTTTLSNEINETAPRDALTAVNVNHTGSYPNYGSAPFSNQLAKFNWVLAPQLTFTPFRGKLAIFNKIFVDTDLNVAGGVGFVGIQERANCGGANQTVCSDPASFTLASSTKIAPTFAVGLNFYPGDFWSLGVDLRALPFSWNLAGFDTRGRDPTATSRTQR